MTGEVWPPIYDFEELAQTIRRLVGSSTLAKQFYQTPLTEPRLCQGDIIWFEAELPHLDSGAQPAAEDSVAYWMILGNTCDLARDVSEGALVPDHSPVGPRQCTGGACFDGR